MKIHIIITTYNRSEMLRQLLFDIINQKADYELSIAIYDDCSDGGHSIANLAICNQLSASYFHSPFNYGKKKYFELINKIFKEIPESDYYFFLADDMRLKDNYFERAIQTFVSIQDYNKICLNTDTDGRLGKQCWTDWMPVDMGSVYKSQWVDMCFISTERLFREVGEIRVGDRWAVDESLGSGVGAVISRNLHFKKLGMYQVKEEMIIHGNHESKMNPR